jgi:hypothetical protein
MTRSGPRRRRLMPVTILAVATLIAGCGGASQGPARVSASTNALPSSTPITNGSDRTATTSTQPPGTSTTAVPNLPGVPAATWSDMTSGLKLTPTVVDCASTTLCVFTGTSVSNPDQSAVAVSVGPFQPGAKVTGNFTTLPTGIGAPIYVSCPTSTLCVLSAHGAILTSTSPLSGNWVQQVVAPPGQPFAGVSCPTVTFCAVVTIYGEVETSDAPTDGPSAWVRTTLTATEGAFPESLSCFRSHPDENYVNVVIRAESRRRDGPSPTVTGRQGPT